MKEDGRGAIEEEEIPEECMCGCMETQDTKEQQKQDLVLLGLRNKCQMFTLEDNLCPSGQWAREEDFQSAVLNWS